MDTTQNLGVLLAPQIDFRPADRARLESYFLERFPDVMCRNPTLRAASVAALVEMASTLEECEVEDLVKLHELNEPQRATLLSSEDRRDVLYAFLEHQQPTKKEIRRITRHRDINTHYNPIDSRPARLKNEIALSHLESGPYTPGDVPLGRDVSDLKAALWGGYVGVTEPISIERLVVALGVEPRLWTTFLGLSETWKDSVGELVDTTLILSKTCLTR